MYAASKPETLNPKPETSSNCQYKQCFASIDDS